MCSNVPFFTMIYVSVFVINVCNVFVFYDTCVVACINVYVCVKLYESVVFMTWISHVCV